MPNKPNFFIIGAAKAGTTSLYKYLDQHPGIYFSPIKEPNYFSVDITPESFKSDYRKQTEMAGDKYFNTKPLRELHLSFVRNETHYFQLFEAVRDETAIGECSTTYLFSDEAAKKIHEFNRDSKIIAILRNPVERAFSHYLMALRFGYSTKSFKAAIEEDLNQKEKGWGISKLYLELGLYNQQLKRYFKTFNPHQIRVYLNEDLNNNPQQIISDICQFLEIEPININPEEKYNVAKIPKSRMLNKFLYQSGLGMSLIKFLPDRWKHKLKEVYFSQEEVPMLLPNDRNYLLDFYQEDIMATAELTGRDLSAWLS
ncbi:MAG: sulfotransferase [Bacteroidetes bacterium]|nr:sulfotransferase [Bacteroidota bacterium]MBL6962370.1 sulfotransferase [Bacteroidota bacterium]